MTVKTILNEEIISELGDLKKIELGSEQHKAMVDAVTKLLDKKVELEKLEIDAKNKELNREIETDLKLQQLEADKKERMTRIVLTILGGASSAALTVWALLISMNYDKTGNILTTEGGKLSLRKLLKF